jgi:hypothetical protein
MEMSGQLHAPAALLPGKEPLVPIGWEGGWAPESVILKYYSDELYVPTTATFIQIIEDQLLIQ